MLITYGATTLTITDPEQGENQQVDSRAIVRQSRNGEQITVSYWVEQVNNTYSYAALTETKKNEVLTFLSLVAGRLVTVTDHNKTYTGMLSTSACEVITVQDICWYDLTFEIMEVTI